MIGCAVRRPDVGTPPLAGRRFAFLDGEVAMATSGDSLIDGGNLIRRNSAVYFDG
jgi:hypothetical protein